MIRNIVRKASTTISEEEKVFLQILDQYPSRNMDEVISKWKYRTQRKDFGNVIQKLLAKHLIIEDNDLEIFMLSSRGMAILN
jgi:predicted flavoprotein YhiN